MSCKKLEFLSQRKNVSGSDISSNLLTRDFLQNYQVYLTLHQIATIVTVKREYKKHNFFSTYKLKNQLEKLEAARGA